jgi:hypothetical protein
MEFKTYTVLTLLVVSSAAMAWQPLTYPIRGQSYSQRSVDTALCYAEANKTKVSIVHESQIPPRNPPPSKTSSTGVPSRPPLPPSTFSAAPTNTGLPTAASDSAASAALTAALAGGASAVRPASAANAASDALAALATPAAGVDPAALAALTGASGAAGASNVALPPLPAPEPPMTRYWAAYGACMQAKGYVVAQ